VHTIYVDKLSGNQLFVLVSTCNGNQKILILHAMVDIRLTANSVMQRKSLILKDHTWSFIKSCCLLYLVASLNSKIVSMKIEMQA